MSGWQDSRPTAIDTGGESEMVKVSQGQEAEAVNAEDDDDDDDNVSFGDESDHMEEGDDEDIDNGILNMKRASVVYSDVRRGDLWKACYDITMHPFFWIIVTALVCAEPCLCSYDPYEYDNVLTASWIILAVSTFCLVIQVGGRTYILDERAILQKAQELHSRHNKNMQFDADTATSGSKKFVTLVRTMLSGSFVLELGCLAIGWIFIFYLPGIAALRSFRMMRVLWYHELPPQIQEPLKGIMSMILGRDLTNLVFKVMKFATMTLSHLGQEMLFLTKKSRGGFVLMVILFFMAYVLACAIWVETRETDLGHDFCKTLEKCTYTLLRLTFYDGDGLDLAYSLVENHPILFAITCFYLCVTSFGILNGMIGVFGDIFKDDSDRVFETKKAVQAKQQRLENEHFQRYNNTSESLVMVTLKLNQLEEQNELFRQQLLAISKATGAKVEVPTPSSRGNSSNSSKTKRHQESLRSFSSTFGSGN